jgi:hypothetical protein
VLWAPYLQRDSRATAQRASLYMSDRRVHHFWDLWRFGTRVYSEQMSIPTRFAWDMLVFYKPHLMWRDNPPEPTLWLHGSADYGPPYSKDALESGLKEWLER